MRLDQLRAKFDELKIDTLYVTQGDNRRYLSGFTGSSGELVITRAHALIMTDSRYWQQAEQQARDFELVQVKGKPGEQIKATFERVGAKRVGFESATVTVDQYERLRELTGGAVEWVATRGAVDGLREVKDAGELAALRRAIALTDEAFTWLIGQLEPGVTEVAVAWELEKYMREHGASGLSFESIVAGGPNAAKPHARPEDRVIQAGEPLTIDMGAIVDAYHADLTRTIVLGEPDDKFREIYAIVLEAQERACQGIRAGMSGKEADALARDVIAKAGYGDYFGHSLGHGVGLATHEGPRLSPLNDDPLPVGSTVTVEPGIYLPGWGGVRIEDVVRLGPDGAEVLSHATKDPHVAV